VISEAAYDARGRLNKTVFASGVVSTAVYDVMDRVTSLETKGATKTFQSLSYSYDRVGNMLRIADALRSEGPLSGNRQFQYDSLYRLTGGQGANKTWSYEYELDGRFKSTATAGAYTYDTGHRAKTIGGAAYRYDKAGNVLERPDSKQEFDAKGRLTSVTAKDGTAVKYRYDFTGTRAVKESDGPAGKHRVVYVDRVSEERDGELVNYVFLGAKRVAKLGGPRPVSLAAAILGRLPVALAALSVIGFAIAVAAQAARRMRRRARPAVALATALAFCSFTIHGCSNGQEGTAPLGAVYYHDDHLGGMVVQTDDQGALVSEAAYDPFGVSLASSSEPYGFTGMELERESGLYDFKARAYDPVIGRFISADPAVVGTPELAAQSSRSIDPYSYANGNPLRYVDPDGRFPQLAVFALVVATLAAIATLALNTHTKNRQVEREWNAAQAEFENRTAEMTSCGPDNAEYADALAKRSQTEAQLREQVDEMNGQIRDFVIVGAAAGLEGARMRGGTKGSAVVARGATAQGLGFGKDDLVLGLNKGGALKRWTAANGGKTFGEFDVPGNNFSEQIQAAMRKATAIRVNLDGVNPALANDALNENREPINGYTNYELYLLKSDPDLLNKTTFYKNNTEAPKPF